MLQGHRTHVHWLIYKHSPSTTCKVQARKAIDDAPFTCEEALGRRLIDEARYRQVLTLPEPWWACMPQTFRDTGYVLRRDEVDNAFTNSNGQKLLRVPLSRYLRMTAAARGEKPGSDVSESCLSGYR